MEILKVFESLDRTDAALAGVVSRAADGAPVATPRPGSARGAQLVEAVARARARGALSLRWDEIRADAPGATVLKTALAGQDHPAYLVALADLLLAEHGLRSERAAAPAADDADWD